MVLQRCSVDTLAATWPGLVLRPDAEAYLIDQRALVLVDRLEVVQGPAASARLEVSLKGLEEARLALVDGPEQLDDRLVHGTYSGWFNGASLFMDQYVELRNGVPETVVRVITRPGKGDEFHVADYQEQVLALLPRRRTS